jgi:uncharacterized phage protein gp47/JayE
MADLTSFLPLVSRTLDDIRASMDAAVNRDRSPEDSLWVDTVEGGFYWDMTQVVALEFERLWDMLGVQTPAASNPIYGFGDYLDDIGASLDQPRLEATTATGTVTFSGTDTTVVSTGTQVAIPLSQPDMDEDDQVSFMTTAGGTITGGTVDLAVQADEAGSRGNVAIGQISVLITPVDGVTSITNAAATGGGTDVETDENYRDRLLLAYAPGSGAGTRTDYERWSLSYSGVGRVKVDGATPAAGQVTLTVTDGDHMPVGKPIYTGLREELDPPKATTVLDGSQNISGGTLTVLDTTGFETANEIVIDKYIIAYTGVTATTFTGCTGGPSIVYPDAEQVSQGGGGTGRAPVGVDVFVTTPDVVDVDVDATMTFKPGYSLTGTGGTTALQGELETAIMAFINDLDAGDDVILNAVAGAFFTVRGVQDISGLQLNAAASDVTIDPDEIAKTDVITLV